MRRHWITVALALTIGFAAIHELHAQASYPEPVREWDNDWTVLTMGPDGSWGVASDGWVIVALTRAIDECRAKSRTELGCGAIFTTIRAGWSLGFRCGDRNILMAEASLEDAEFRADWREYELRTLYDPDMPPCIRVVTVDPQGRIVPPHLWHSERIFSSP